MKQLTIVFFLGCTLWALFPDKLQAQEFNGLRTDNYSGSNGMLLNPATPLSGVLPWDINIAAAGFFADNNYAYAPDQTTLSLLNSNGEQILVNYYHPQKVKAHENMLLQFPSGFLRIRDIGVGLFFTARSAGYLTSEKYTPGVPAYDTILLDVPTDFPAFQAGMLNWSEIGINGEMTVRDNSVDALYAGANIKYLMGFDGMDFSNNELFTFSKDQVLSSVTSLDADFSYSTNFGSNRMSDRGNYQVNGSGFGVDAGIFYLLKEGAREDYKNPVQYNWKLGVSVLDLGFIHFKRNAGDYHLGAEELFTIATASLDSIDDLDEFNLTGSRNLYDNALASQTSDEFHMLLPAAITLSADKNLGKGFFVNGLIVRRIPHVSSNLIARANIISIAPRYEKRWFGFTVPVVLYEDRDLHLGTAARLGFFTIGSDNILSWLVKDEYTGTDIYAGIKINPFWLNKPSRSARQLDCPKVWK